MKNVFFFLSFLPTFLLAQNQAAAATEMMSDFGTAKLSFAIKDTSHYAVYFIEAEACTFYDTLWTPIEDTHKPLNSQIPWDKIPDVWWNYDNFACTYAVVQANSYHYNMQGTAFEYLFRFRIQHIGTKSPTRDTMMIVFPITKHGWDTRIELDSIAFKKGYFEIGKDLQYEYESEEKLKVSLPKHYIWQAIDPKKRKIKWRK